MAKVQHTIAVSLGTLLPFVVIGLAAFLLAPLFLGFQDADRLALVLLSIVSLLLIQSNEAASITKSALNYSKATFSAGTLVLAASLFFSIDKLAFLSGILLLYGAVLLASPKSIKAPLLSLVCLVVIIPAPAQLEADFAFWLAEQEAEFFVLAAQTLGMDIYRLGTQVVAGETSVTINGDCSGTLLFWPTLLGFAVAASSEKYNRTKVVLLLTASIPFAFTLNLVRLLILLIANFVMDNDAAASFHDTLGWFVMPLAWIAPILMISPSAVFQAQFQNISGPIRKAVFSFAAAIALIGFFPEPSTNTKTVELSAPYYFSGWAGLQAEVTDKEKVVLGTNLAVRREYTHTNRGDKMLATFMVHSSAKKGREHDSQTCYRSLGWIVEDLTTSMLENGKLVRSMTVRNHQQVQHVTEYIDPSLGSKVGQFLRVQLVWPPTKTKADRMDTLKKLLVELYSEQGVIQ